MKYVAVGCNSVFSQVLYNRQSCLFLLKDSMPNCMMSWCRRSNIRARRASVVTWCCMALQVLCLCAMYIYTDIDIWYQSMYFTAFVIPAVDCFLWNPYVADWGRTCK